MHNKVVKAFIGCEAARQRVCEAVRLRGCEDWGSMFTSWGRDARDGVQWFISSRARATQHRYYP